MDMHHGIFWPNINAKVEDSSTTNKIKYASQLMMEDSAN